MHGLDIQELSLAEAGEALIYCNYDTVSFVTMNWIRDYEQI